MTAHGLFALLFAPSGQNAGGGMTVFLVQIGALIAIFYFMLIRPQRRQQERHRQLLASLQRGDRIVTSGGIIGEVVHLKDDEVTVKSGESRLIVQRANIANILNRSVEAAKPRSEEHTSELQSRLHLVCRLLLEKKKTRFPSSSTTTV